MNASGAKLVFDNLEKKFKGSIFDFVLYFVQIFIWYVSPFLIFLENKSNIFLYFSKLILDLNGERIFVELKWSLNLCFLIFEVMLILSLIFIIVSGL